jgi:hypothetical protein
VVRDGWGWWWGFWGFEERRGGEKGGGYTAVRDRSMAVDN